MFTSSNADALTIAKSIAVASSDIKQQRDFVNNLEPLYKTERFHLYKIGSVIIVSYGIGIPSLLICLNEVVKLLVHAQAKNVAFLKVSASLSVDDRLDGAIVLAKEALNSDFSPKYEAIECGKNHMYQTQLDKEFTLELFNFMSQCSDVGSVKLATSISGCDYYELEWLLDSLAVNVQPDKFISVDDTAFAGFCYKLGIKALSVNSVFKTKLINLKDMEESCISMVNSLAKFVVLF